MTYYIKKQVASYEAGELMGGQIKIGVRREAYSIQRERQGRIIAEQ